VGTFEIKTRYLLPKDVQLIVNMLESYIEEGQGLMSQKKFIEFQHVVGRMTRKYKELLFGHLKK